MSSQAEHIYTNCRSPAENIKRLGEVMGRTTQKKTFQIITVITLFLALLGITFTFLGSAVPHAAALDFVVDITYDEYDENEGECTVGDCSLREAIRAASAGDRIVLSGETYTLTLGEIEIDKSLIISGTNRDTTIIDAGLGHRIFDVTGAAVTITAVTLQNGRILSDTTDNGDGGALYIHVDEGVEPDVWLLDSRLISNTADSQGGAVFLDRGSITIDNSALLTNTAQDTGGAVYSNLGQVTIRNSQINGNSAKNGAGIHLEQTEATLQFESGTINNNNATLNQPGNNFGGGVSVGRGSAILTGGEIFNNQSIRGGGVFNRNGQISIAGTDILSNTAVNGGGVYMQGVAGNAVITHSRGVISGNLATGTESNHGGGGIHNFQGDLVITGGGIYHNQSAAYGGGVFHNLGALQINNGTISNNSAGFRGGGIYVGAGGSTIEDTTIAENYAYVGGGGLATTTFSETVTIIDRSTIISNSTNVTATGGGIFNSFVMTVTNSNISGNQSDAGAGIYNRTDGVISLTNVTIFQNIASGSGGGIANDGTSVALLNSIVGGNSGGSGPDCSGTIISADYNLIQDETDCTVTGDVTNNLNGDPQLGPLGYNGGTLLNHEPLFGSPVIDAGSDAACESRDLRNNFRPIDGDNNESAICDIGAVEFGVVYLVDDVTVTESDSNTTADVLVTRSLVTGTTTVDYALIAGSATAVTDYDNISGTLTFDADDITQTVPITIVNDTLDEFTEQFTFELSNPTGNTGLGDSTAEITILDNDDPPTISISDSSGEEEAGGSILFTATLSTRSGKPITVTYQTQNGVAIGGSDFISVTDSLQIPAGQLTGTIPISLINDELVEGSETFNLQLSEPVNVTLSDATGSGVIEDDEPEPELSINDVQITELDAGESNQLTFTVTLSAASQNPVTVTYGTVDGTAVAGSDFTSIADQELVFEAAETSKPITVTILGDDLNEVNETFTVQLSNPQRAVIDDGSGTGTILDEDPEPTLSISGGSVDEDDGPLDLTVTLSAVSGRPISVTYQAVDGLAENGADYTLSTDTLTIPAGNISGTIAIPITNDSFVEGSESFQINLQNPFNAAISDGSATVTINDDEPVPGLRINDATVLERNEGENDLLTFTVSLSAASQHAVTVTYQTADNTAVADSDYLGDTDTLVFSPGETSKSIQILVYGDKIDEADETFNVQLSNPVRAVVSDGQGVGTIQADGDTTIYMPMIINR